MESQISLDYDLENQIALSDDKINPSELIVEEGGIPWIYAENNKYIDEEIDSEKIGKWMLFVSRNKIDSVWNDVKIGIRNGNLWHSKVSTKNDKPNHAIMIYTKDYTDIEDVIRVLEYLETNGLTENKCIYYKTDAYTRAGIYGGGSIRASIYASNTIRKRLGI